MSELHSEDQELSSVAEMHALVHEAADYTASSQNWKDRVQAAARAFGLDWGRAKAFYYRDARRVDAKEMDDARRAIERLRRERERREAAEHIAWLRTTIEQHRARGSGMDSRSLLETQRALDEVERLIGAQGNTVGTVAVSAASD